MKYMTTKKFLRAWQVSVYRQSATASASTVVYATLFTMLVAKNALVVSRFTGVRVAAYVGDPGQVADDVKNGSDTNCHNIRNIMFYV